jgi:hypothetical protein
MAKTIDLSAYKQEYMTIIMPNDGSMNGETINLKKPTQSLAIMMMAMEKIKTESAEDQMEALDELYEMLVAILNNNKEKITFTLEQVKDSIEPELLRIIFEAYTEFLQEITERKN